ARKLVQTAETAQAAAARAGQKPVQWHQRWASVIPPEAAFEEVFGVRLAPHGPSHYTLKDFLDAMQLGLIDRSRGAYVPKHALEAAFVRHAADSLLLCSYDEKTEVYTHLPAPATVRTGVVGPSTSKELCCPQPHHSYMLRLEGVTFPFAVSFTTVASRTLGFIGVGAHALTYNTPWNPLDYGDVLWAREAEESLVLLPLVAALSAIVSDPDIPIGPFPPLPASSLEGATGAAAGLAVLQAALFNDVKMWPVAFPHASRARWDYALRSLKVALADRREEEGDNGGQSCPRMPG
ncbi:unnamed protein product, partial [Polarella glacialis]